jgi:hypothetical protein
VSAPLQHRLRPGNQHNMKHLQSILLLILLALAGGHTVSFGQTALACAGWELGAQANAAAAKPEAKWQKQVQLNHAYADEFVLTYDHIPDHLEYTNDNYHKPVAERTIDNEDITPLTWKWVRLEMPEAGGSVMTACLRRPDWWLTANQADVLGNWVALSLPEMGIHGKAQVKEIIPSYVDTRFADFPATGNLKYRPITGWFARTVPEVWNYVFTSGDTIGATPNHPFFSEDRQAYIASGDLRIGERVKLEGDRTATLVSKTKRGNEQEKVYNLEVYRDHNFHVGVEGLLVHNSCANAIEDYVRRVSGKPNWTISKPSLTAGTKPGCINCKQFTMHNGQKIYFDDYNFPVFEEFAGKGNVNGQVIKYDSPDLQGYASGVPPIGPGSDIDYASNWLNAVKSQYGNNIRVVAT